MSAQDFQESSTVKLEIERQAQQLKLLAKVIAEHWTVWSTNTELCGCGWDVPGRLDDRKYSTEEFQVYCEEVLLPGWSAHVSEEVAKALHDPLLALLIIEEAKTLS